MKHSAPSISQDSAWKDIIEDLFEDFLAFFFPPMHADIDFSKGYTFLDKELQKIAGSAAVGKRFADKLVKVFLKNGEEKWLLIHVEVQGYKESDLAERMFIYNYRIFDRYKKEVVSAVILTDDDPAYRPQRYVVNRWGFRHEMYFPVVKLLDFRERRADLAGNLNPFALVVATVLRSIDGKGAIPRLADAKKQLLTVLFEKKYTKKRIEALIKFIDWMLQLPETLDQHIEDAIIETTGGKRMPYVTSWERRAAERAAEKAKKEGLAEGLTEGIEKGLEEGTMKTKIETARKMLGEGLDIEVIERVTGLDKGKILQLQDATQEAETGKE